MNRTLLHAARQQLPHIAALGFLALSGLAQAGIIRDDVAQDLYDTNIASNPAYTSVGLLTYNVGTDGYLCSGTVIGSSTVITAAHCLDAVNTNNVNFEVAGNTYAGDSWVVHPSWNGNVFMGNDMAVLQLSSEVTGVPIAPLYAGDVLTVTGATTTTVGYGTTGTGLTGYITGTQGTLHAGQNVVDAFISVGGVPEVLLVDFDNPSSTGDNTLGVFGSSEIPLEYEYLLAPGDSGGGQFIEVGGTEYLVGINSFIWAPTLADWPGIIDGDGNPNADYGDIGATTYIPSSLDWIHGQIAGVPVPGSMLLFLTGALLGWRMLSAKTRN